MLLKKSQKGKKKTDETDDKLLSKLSIWKEQISFNLNIVSSLKLLFKSEFLIVFITFSFSSLSIKARVEGNISIEEKTSPTE